MSLLYYYKPLFRPRGVEIIDAPQVDKKQKRKKKRVKKREPEKLQVALREDDDLLMLLGMS